MGQPVRVGVIGTGFMGGVHTRAARWAGAEVTHVAAARLSSARDAAKRWMLSPDAATSVEELIESDQLDVVHVCTPNAFHARLALAAIRAGKSVVCEKPLATSTADARALLAEARSSGLVAAVPFVYRYYPAVRETRARISAGEAGDLWLLHGSYLQDWLASRDDTDWRVDPRIGGPSRAFADIGVHWCDLMEFVTGHRITRVNATLAQAHRTRAGHGAPGPVATEDGAAILFETNRHAHGSLVVSQVSLGRKNRLWFSFDGTDASFVFDQEQPDNLWIGGAQETRVVPRGPETLSAYDAAALSHLPAGHPQGYQDCFNAFVADAYAAMDGAIPEGMPTFSDGLRAAAITDAVLRSSATHTWTEIEE